MQKITKNFEYKITRNRNLNLHFIEFTIFFPRKTFTLFLCINVKNDSWQKEEKSYFYYYYIYTYIQKNFSFFVAN